MSQAADCHPPFSFHKVYNCVTVDLHDCYVVADGGGGGVCSIKGHNLAIKRCLHDCSTRSKVLLVLLAGIDSLLGLASLFCLSSSEPHPSDLTLLHLSSLLVCIYSFVSTCMCVIFCLYSCLWLFFVLGLLFWV